MQRQTLCLQKLEFTEPVLAWSKEIDRGVSTLKSREQFFYPPKAAVIFSVRLTLKATAKLPTHFHTWGFKMFCTHAFTALNSKVK